MPGPYRVPDAGANLNVSSSAHQELERAVHRRDALAPVALAPQVSPPNHDYSTDTTRPTYYWQNFTENDDAANHQEQNFIAGTRGGSPDAGRGPGRKRFLSWAPELQEKQGFDPRGGSAGGVPQGEPPQGHLSIDAGNWFKRDVSRLRPSAFHEQLPEGP